MSPDATRDALRLYLVLDPDFLVGEPGETLHAALAGGATMVQLRSKGRTDRETLAIGRPLRAICTEAGVPFVVNDRLDLALALNAEGIHLGVDDLPIEDARRLAGPEFLIGYSPETDEQARSASERGADYLGIGPVFDTATKSDAGDALGVTEFSRRRALTDLPVVAIGGIGVANARAAIAAGANGVSVVSAILRASDPEAASRSLAAAVRE
ncbi:MAG: thiamine phosphate synthase [Thermomicrobiales bacterium]